MEPTFGVSDQDTDAAPPPTSEGVNWADCPGDSVVDDGLNWMAVEGVVVAPVEPTLLVPALRVTTAEPLCVGSYRLVAVKITVCAAVIAAGAV